MCPWPRRRARHILSFLARYNVAAGVASRRRRSHQHRSARGKPLIGCWYLIFEPELMVAGSDLSRAMAQWSLEAKFLPLSCLVIAWTRQVACRVSPRLIRNNIIGVKAGVGPA